MRDAIIIVSVVLVLGSLTAGTFYFEHWMRKRGKWKDGESQGPFS